MCLSFRFSAESVCAVLRQTGWKYTCTRGTCTRYRYCIQYCISIYLFIMFFSTLAICFQTSNRRSHNILACTLFPWRVLEGLPPKLRRELWSERMQREVIKRVGESLLLSLCAHRLPPTQRLIRDLLCAHERTPLGHAPSPRLRERVRVLGEAVPQHEHIPKQRGTACRIGDTMAVSRMEK